VSFGHPIVEDTLEWKPQAGIVDSVAARIRKLKRAPLEPTGLLRPQLEHVIEVSACARPRVAG